MLSAQPLKRTAQSGSTTFRDEKRDQLIVSTTCRFEYMKPLISSIAKVTWKLTLAAISTTGAHASGPAFTGVVAEADDASSVFTAPAGMTRLDGDQLTVTGIVAQGFSSFHVDKRTTTIDGGDPDDDSDPVIIPALYYVYKLNEKWRLGASLTVPTGFGADYGNSWAGRYKTVNFSLVYVSVTPAIAYRVNDKLSLGGSLGFNYTQETSEQKIPQLFSDRDGTLKSDLDGVGVNVTLSALYELSGRTRAAIAWTSDSEADLEGKVKLRNLDPGFDEIATELGIKNIDTKVTNTLPQRVLAGVYHELASGKFLTIDTMWVKFSDFSVSNLELNGNKINVSAPSIYNDLWAVTAGMGFPLDSRKTCRVGALYLSQGVDDDDRNFSISIDAMWGVGAGFSYALESGRRLDVNATILNTGDAPVDSEGLVSGRVVGKNKNPYALLVDLSYSF